MKINKSINKKACRRTRNRDHTGTLEKLENRDPSGTLEKTRKPRLRTLVGP